MLERVISGDVPIYVLNKKLPAFLGEQRPMTQELIFAELERVRWSKYSLHATQWLSVFVIIGRRLDILFHIATISISPGPYLLSFLV